MDKKDSYIMKKEELKADGPLQAKKVE